MGEIERTARCACGKATITVRGEPVLNAVCHCNNCQRRTGSAFGLNVYFPDERVLAASGEMGVYRIEGEKSQERFFCAGCGTTLRWRTGWFPGWTGVAGGCFRDEPLPDPEVSVANETRRSWVCIPEGWGTTIQPP